MGISRRSVALAISLSALMGLILATAPARAEISSRDADALSKASLIYVATVRKNGTQSKAAPVWFTTTADNSAILIQTGPGTWKAKRIKRGSPVMVWIGSANGPAFLGKAEITNDPQIQGKILDDFSKRYTANRLFGIGPSRAKFDRGDVVAIKITPLRDLPNGFTSAPGTPPPPLEAGKPAS